MQHYFDNVQDVHGAAVPGVQVLVKTSGGAVASIYSTNSTLNPKSNPLVTATDGTFDFYAAGGSYTATVTLANGTTSTKPVTLFDPNDLSASTGSSLVWTIQAGAGAVAEEVQTVLRKFVFSDAYDTLQHAADAAAGGKLIVRGTNTITAAVTLASNTDVYIEASALVKTNTPDISLFTATGKTNVHFEGHGKLQQTAAGPAAYVAAIVFDTCLWCTVDAPLEFQGFQWAGVYVVNSNRCRVARTYMHDWLGTVANSAGVVIYQDSNDNVVEANHFSATGWMGAYVQDPGGAGTYNPQRNKIRNNRIQDTTAYGAMLYLGHAGNSDNEVNGNTITGVLGTVGAGQYGMGVYAVGNGLGGCKVLDNTVSNCCINQTSTTNGFGGITVTGFAGGAGLVKPVVSDNTVDGMTQGCGIEIVSMHGGCVVGPNSARIPSSNNGTGPGGSSLIGHALYVFDSNDVSVAPGDYVNDGSGAAILLNATDANYDGITVDIGNARAAGSALVVQRTGAFTLSGAISGGTVKSSSDSSNAIALLGFIGTVSGVTLRTGTTSAASAALSVGSSDVRFSNMDVSSTGAYSVSIGSGNTGNWDKNSRYTGRFENSSAGFKTEIYSHGLPSAGIFQISDHAANADVTVGNAKGWYRATAGANHVLGVDWISEGNL